MENVIKTLAKTFSSQLTEHSFGIFPVFGPIAEPKNRQLLAEELSTLGVETIRISDFVDMHVLKTVPHEEKEQMVQDAKEEASQMTSEKAIERMAFQAIKMAILSSVMENILSDLLSDLFSNASGMTSTPDTAASGNETSDSSDTEE